VLSAPAPDGAFIRPATRDASMVDLRVLRMPRVASADAKIRDEAGPLRAFIVLRLATSVCSPGIGESGVLARGQVVLVNVEVIIANPPLALIQALRGQIRDASLQHELTGALPGCIVYPRP
jgi:hypothetical protein